MLTTQLGASEILLYPEQNMPAPLIGVSLNIGYLATSTNVSQGVVTAFLGSRGILLGNLLDESAANQNFGNTLYQWKFGGGQCWYYLKDDARLNQSTRVLLITCPNELFIFKHITGN